MSNTFESRGLRPPAAGRLAGAMERTLSVWAERSVAQFKELLLFLHAATGETDDAGSR